MANEDSMTSAVSEQQEEDPKNESNEQDPDAENSSSDESDSEYSSGEYTDYENDEDEILNYVRPGDTVPESENTAEANIKLFTRILDSQRLKRREEEEEMFVDEEEEQFNFPKDPENWREEDLRELWADAPLKMTKPGWDPVWADEDDWEVVKEEIEAGREPPIAPFYLPYRKPYPAIPTNHFDISNPKAVVEELDRIEEFLKWVSYIFADGSSYEGTVWDDLAHGKGVYVTEQELVRYEGEWLQNNMEGHGVVEVDIPDIEPVPGSKLEEEMRAEGKIIERDYMTPEDKKWLEMDVEDAMQLTAGNYEIPFYENDLWVEYFGSKPEKGRYRYAGQWKHGRMHGCGVFEVNERVLYGRFYFGEFLQEATDCDEDISALHKGIAEVAAAKARMFVNKPDGMVREDRGPYGDPQHPYFYEEEDVWMAPGFINQFYEVPEYWKTYVGEVDEEREMWLNSFYKAPLRLPMPAELEYWWSQDHTPEFVFLNNEPEPDPEDPAKLRHTEDPIILHTPTGNLINYVEDEEHGIRLFWEPDLKEGEEVDPEKLEFLPLGFDEFYGRVGTEKKENIWMRLVSAVENALKPAFDKLEKWSEQKKREGELKIQLIEKESELQEAQMRLEELMEEIEEDLKMKEEEEELKVKMGLQEEKEEEEEKEENGTALSNKDEKALVEDKNEREEEEEVEEEEEEEEDGEDTEDDAPSSFGSVRKNQDPKKNNQMGNEPKNSPFSALSLSLASGSLFSGVPNKILQSIPPSRKVRTTITDAHGPSTFSVDPSSLNNSISFSRAVPSKVSLKISPSQLQPRPVPRVPRSSSLARTHKRRLKEQKTLSNHSAKENKFSILSLHTPIHCFKTLGD